MKWHGGDVDVSLYEPESSIKVYQGKIDAVRTQRSQLERAHGLVTTHTKGNAKERIEHLFVRSGRLKSKFYDLKRELTSEASSWTLPSGPMLAATARLTTAKDQYAQDLARSLPRWRATRQQQQIHKRRVRPPSSRLVSHLSLEQAATALRSPHRPAPVDQVRREYPSSSFRQRLLEPSRSQSQTPRLTHAQYAPSFGLLSGVDITACVAHASIHGAGILTRTSCRAT